MSTSRTPASVLLSRTNSFPWVTARRAVMARVSSVGVAARAQIELDEVYRHSLDEYHRLIEAGGFDDRERVELLDGLLVRMSPKTPRHERAVRWLASWLIRALDGDRYTVGIAGPLTLGSS